MATSGNNSVNSAVYAQFCGICVHMNEYLNYSYYSAEYKLIIHYVSSSKSLVYHGS